MPQYDGSIRINTEIDAKNVNSQMMRVVNSIRKAEAEVSRLQARMKELETTNIPTSEYAKLQKELDAAIKKYEELSEQVATFERIGTDKNFTPFRMARDEAQELYMKIEDIRGAMFELEEGGKAFTSGVDTEEYARAAEKVRELTGNIEVSKQRLSELNAKQKPITKDFEKIKTSAKKSFGAIGSGAKKSSGLLSTFSSRLKGLALSLLIFNWISKGFNAMVTVMKKGFENLSGYSSDYASSIQSLKNAMSTLGNSFAAAFAPIVQMVIPWITSLINALSTAMTYVAQFIAILGGKSTFTRAKQVQDSYNKSLGGTASAAKKAYGALAKFDDLDVLQKKEDESGGGGDAVGDMFEEVPVDSEFKNWLDEILEKLKPILDYLKKLKDIFMEGFWDGLGDYGYRLDIIRKGLQQIKDALIDIWTDPAVLSAADEWLRSLVYMLGSLVGSIASIALTIAAAFIGGLGDYMEKNVDRIKAFLISAFNIGTEINYMLADLFQSIAYIFEAFASENGIRFMSALIGSIADASMGLIELALRLARDFLEMLILPITENKEAFRTALEGMIGAAATVLEGLKTSIDNIFDNLLSVYDTKIKPFFDSIANGLTRIVGAFLTAWNGNIIPMLERVGAKFSELLTNYIVPFVNSIVDFVGNIATVLQAFWESFLVPLVEWVITYAVPIIGEIIEVLVNIIIIAVESILAILTEMMNIINNVLIPIWQSAWEIAGNLFDIFFSLLNTLSEAIKELFSGLFKSVKLLVEGDWKGAWENAKKVFETFREKVSGIVDTVRGLLEGFFEWVSSTISSILEGLSSIGSAISGAFSKASSFVGSISGGGLSTMSVTNYSMPEIPALASGTVIRGGDPFFALLGDQPRGQTNIEAPLSTIRQALREEMSDFSFGGGQLKVVLQVNGSDLAQATLNDFLSEMNRQGLDVEILGVT